MRRSKMLIMWVYKSKTDYNKQNRNNKMLLIQTLILTCRWENK